MAAFSPSWSSETTSSTPEPARLERAEELLVGGLALGVCYLHGEDLPEAVVPHPRDDQDPLADHPPIHPHLLVASVHEQVGVASASSRRLPPRFEL